MAINLDPQLGADLVKQVQEICDGYLNDIAKTAFEHCQLLGDNAVVSQMEEKFMSFQTQYNQNIFPAFTSCAEVYKAHTNYAELQEQMKADTSVDQSSAGMAAAEGLGAATKKIGDLTDLIS